MLYPIRKSDGQIANAYAEGKENGLFRCVECGYPVTLRTGRNCINYFAHENPIARHYVESESKSTSSAHGLLLSVEFRTLS